MVILIGKLTNRWNQFELTLAFLPEVEADGVRGPRKELT